MIFVSCTLCCLYYYFIVALNYIIILFQTSYGTLWLGVPVDCCIELFISTTPFIYVIDYVNIFLLHTVAGLIQMLVNHRLLLHAMRSGNYTYAEFRRDMLKRAQFEVTVD